MNKCILQLLALSSLFITSTANSGVVGRFNLPNTTGDVSFNCNNPHRVLAVVRGSNSTEIIQAGPHGTVWQVSLPPMPVKYDSYWMAPEGDSAVVALVTGIDGTAYLVSGQHEPVEIRGAIAAVDFQGKRVLVATVDTVGVRVRVYNTDSGKLVGDTSFTDVVAVEVDKPFYIRLAGNGKFYYYVRETKRSGQLPVARDVKTGEEKLLPYEAVAGRLPNGIINDMMIYSGKHGYMIIGGELFAMSARGLISIPVDPRIGNIRYLVEMNDRAKARQAVEGVRGWGVFDTRRENWLLVEKGGGYDISSSEFGLTVVQQSLKTDRIRTFDFSNSGRNHKAVRVYAGKALKDGTPVCANAFGFMRFKNGKFSWHRSAPLK